ncbi:MAG: hypothetical protein LC746_13830 [Acidobacteria bacterium]|nr:hypothetical protein [Acidobacteriota bacterium]
MKNTLKKTALALALALTVGAPAAVAKGRKSKPSAEHVAAVKKCKDDYAAAVKDAKTKKGKERSAAMAAAKAAEKQCIANAPK